MFLWSLFICHMLCMLYLLHHHHRCHLENENPIVLEALILISSLWDLSESNTVNAGPIQQPWPCPLPLIPGAPQKEVYFMGLIDVLTQYDTKKKAAHAAKTVKHGVSSMREDGGEEAEGCRHSVAPVLHGGQTSDVVKCIQMMLMTLLSVSVSSLFCRRLVPKSPQSTPSSTPNDFATSSPTSLRNPRLWPPPQVDPTES